MDNGRDRWVVVAQALALVALAWSWLLLPYFGSLGELAAVIAPPFFATVLAIHTAVFIWRRQVLVAISAVAWLVSASVMIASPRAPTNFASPRDPIVVVAANLHRTNRTPRQAARDVVARDPDVIVISENTLGSNAVLKSAFPYHLTAAYAGGSYTQFVASRFPLRALPVPSDVSQAIIVEVSAPTPFVLVGIHLPRAGINLPYLRGQMSFAGQKIAVRALTRTVDASTLPVVVAGDLNVSDRTAAYHRLVAHRRDAMRAGWARSTYRQFPWNFFALRIDHVIIDGSWCAEHATRFHLTGSDHDGVQVTIGPCA